MLIIWPDTNAFDRDRFLEHESAKNLLEFLAPSRVELHVSPVVTLELECHIEESFSQAKATTVARLQKLAVENGLDASESIARANEDYWALAEHALARSRTVWGADGIVHRSFPSSDAQDLVARELARLRPFKQSGKGAIGLRDTIIWLGALEALTGDQSTRLLLITDDKGFLSTNDGSDDDGDSDGLHSDLLSELTRHSIALDRVSLARNVPEAVAWLKQQDGTMSKRERQIIRALVRSAPILSELEWERLTKNTLALASPHVDVDLPPKMNHLHLIAAEFLGDVSISSGDPARCTHKAELKFGGSMDEASWIELMEAENTLLTSGEFYEWVARPRDDEVWMETTREVLVETLVSYDKKAERASIMRVERVELSQPSPWPTGKQET